MRLHKLHPGQQHVLHNFAAEGLARTTALIMPYVISLPMPPTARRFSLTASRSGSVSGLAPFPIPPALKQTGERGVKHKHS